MSNEFGYIPESPEQSFGNNKGIFTPTDIYDLTRADKYTNYGQLELIETQTASAVATLDFTSLQESTYNVHFLTMNNIENSTEAYAINIQLFENGVIENGNVYQYGVQNMRTDGTFSEGRDTGSPSMFASADTDNTEYAGGSYVYLYNLGDSSKYSFSTFHSMAGYDNGTDYGFARFGSSVLPQASQVTGIRVISSAGGGNISGTFSLYGIKEYS